MILLRGGIQVDAGDVEFACNSQNDYADGTEPAVLVGISRGSLEERFDSLPELAGAARRKCW